MHAFSLFLIQVRHNKKKTTNPSQELEDPRKEVREFNEELNNQQGIVEPLVEEIRG